MRALSRRNDDPKRGVAAVRRRPRRLRDGRGRRRRRARGARARDRRAARRSTRELLGYGVSSDANHITEPDPTGENPARAMQMAFGDAGIDPSEIGYINAHGTSTPLGDALGDAGDQARARRGERLRDRRSPRRRARPATASAPPARSRRSSRCSRCSDGVLPPTINYEVADPECDLDYIPNEARDVARRERSVSRTRSASAATTPAIVFRKLRTSSHGRGSIRLTWTRSASTTTSGRTGPSGRASATASGRSALRSAPRRSAAPSIWSSRGSRRISPLPAGTSARRRG